MSTLPASDPALAVALAFGQRRRRCLHCERRPARTAVGLCRCCHMTPGIHQLYARRRRGWTPAWERHLIRLAQRAKLRLPLFPASEGPPGAAETPAGPSPSPRRPRGA